MSTPPPPARGPADLASIFPPDARHQLTEAAKVVDEAARRVAVDRAVAMVRRKYPQFFKPEGV